MSEFEPPGASPEPPQQPPAENNWRAWMNICEVVLPLWIGQLEKHGLDDYPSVFFEVTRIEEMQGLHPTANTIDDLPPVLQIDCGIVLASVRRRGILFVTADDIELTHAAHIVAKRYPEIDMYSVGRNACLVHRAVPLQGQEPSVGGLN